MIGVVLWSSVDDRKAVLWCEDHGDLAFFNARDLDLTDAAFFDAGDMVQFDVELECRLRKAKNVRLLEQRACADLPEKLALTEDTGIDRRAGTGLRTKESPQNDNVVAFKPTAAAPLAFTLLRKA